MRKGEFMEFKEEDNFIFRDPFEQYQATLDPVREYLKQASIYMSKMYNLSPEEAIRQVKLNVKKHNPKIPKVTYRKQNKDGDRITESCSITDYIRDAQAENEILVPSFTSYYSKSKFDSIHSKFLKDNVKKRKEAKLLSFKYKQQGDNAKADYYNVLQKIMKILNNSLSGAYGSSSTVLYNPSAHYTLTSITRSLSSIGNAVTEAIVAGNFLFRTPSDVFNYISSVLANVDINFIRHTLKKYNLHIPTPSEVFDSLHYSFSRYWSDADTEHKIMKYLEACNGEELAAILYTNNLFSLCKYNDSVMREFLGELSKKCFGVVNEAKYMEKCPEGTDILAKIICAKEIKGKDINYKELDKTDLMSYLSSTVVNIVEVLGKYAQLIKAFLKTRIMPINVAYIKEILRDSIVLSDTDSTCGSYDKWVEWYCGKVEFTETASAISAAIMFINTQAMDHNIKILARNMNVGNADVELLKMKNEFQWSVFVPTNNTKHYFANTCIQEGNVYREPELEKKGVHLIGSAANPSITKRVEKMMQHINKEVSKGKTISLAKYVTFVANLEREIESKIKKGDLTIFKLEKIKDPKSYKDPDKTKTPYLHHILWETVFGPKYGSNIEPPYLVIKIPTILDTTKRLTDYLDFIPDDEVKIPFKVFIEKYSKNNLPTIRVPVQAVKTMGALPQELLPIIDYKRIIEDNLTSAYIVLETLGFYRKENYLLKEQGY